MAESGRMRLPAKKVTGKLVRGFKSHSLRNEKGQSMKTQYTLVVSLYLDGDESAAVEHASKIGEELLIYGADSYQLLSVNNDLLWKEHLNA
jgi:hypothetical protein